MKRPMMLLVGGLAMACGGSVNTGERHSTSKGAETGGSSAKSGSGGAPSAETGGQGVIPEDSPGKPAGGGGTCGSIPGGSPGYPGSGIGGAGFMLTTVCYACGYERESPECEALVNSTQMIDDPLYYPCFDKAFAFAECMENAGTCACGQEIPAACAALQAESIACE
jgi:hypothetical protein